MQMRYLAEINDRFNLPVLRIPMMQEEIKGLASLKNAIDAVTDELSKIQHYENRINTHRLC